MNSATLTTTPSRKTRAHRERVLRISIREKLEKEEANHTATALPKRWPAVMDAPIRVAVTPRWSALALDKTRDQYFPQRGTIGEITTP